LFFFIDAPPTALYTLSLHDALPIYRRVQRLPRRRLPYRGDPLRPRQLARAAVASPAPVAAATAAARAPACGHAGRPGPPLPGVAHPPAVLLGAGVARQ